MPRTTIYEFDFREGQQNKQKILKCIDNIQASIYAMDSNRCNKLLWYQVIQSELKKMSTLINIDKMEYIKLQLIHIYID